MATVLGYQAATGQGHLQQIGDATRHPEVAHLKRGTGRGDVDFFWGGWVLKIGLKNGMWNGG